MGNQQTNVTARNEKGEHVALQHTQTDSPILPAANLEHLKQIDPSLVPFVVQQTELEATFRRTENKRTNTFVFIERVSGVVVGALVAIFGLVVSAYVIVQGHDWAGVGIGGATLVTIVTVLVTRNKNEEEKPSPKQTPKRPPRNRG